MALSTMVEGVEAVRRCRHGQHSAIIGVSDHIDSYLESHTIEMTGTRQANGMNRDQPIAQSAASRTSRPASTSFAALIDQLVKSWPSLALHPRGPKHQSPTDGAALPVRGPY
jgi:hypothetical protein